MKFQEAKSLIKEGDVLLFRSSGFPSIGWLVSSITGGNYSHVGIASVSNGEPSIIEFREFGGSREVTLESQITKEGIDIYRFSPKITVWKADEEKWVTKEFTEEKGKCITRQARRLTGKGYGWLTIWKIYKAYLPFFRILKKRKNGDDLTTTNYVCSTLVSYSSRMCYADVCPNLPDDRTTPADISQSAVLFPILRIVP